MSYAAFSTFIKKYNNDNDNKSVIALQVNSIYTS